MWYFFLLAGRARPFFPFETLRRTNIACCKYFPGRDVEQSLELLGGRAPPFFRKVLEGFYRPFLFLGLFTGFFFIDQHLSLLSFSEIFSPPFPPPLPEGRWSRRKSDLKDLFSPPSSGALHFWPSVTFRDRMLLAMVPARGSSASVINLLSEQYVNWVRHFRLLASAG